MDAYLGEGCDDDAANSDTLPNACRTSCQEPRCGDGVQDSGEVIAGNRASYDGGGVFIAGGEPNITASVIAGNLSSSYGAGVNAGSGGGSLTITGCSIVSNWSVTDEGSGLHVANSSVMLTNSVVWGNRAPSIDVLDDGIIQVAHSAVEGGHAGGTMIVEDDPGFVVVPGNAGTWASVIYDDGLFVTALQSSGATWAPGALVGLFVRPTGSDARWFPIVDNTADTVWVHGDMTDVTAAGQTYSLHDLHLSAASPCVDAGYGCTDPLGCEARSPYVALARGGPQPCHGRRPPWRMSLH